MKTIMRAISLVGVLTLFGCHTFRRPLTENPILPVRDTGETFTFVIHSDPEGSDVFLQQATGGEKLLGKTPLTLPLQLTYTKKSGLFNFKDKGSWEVHSTAESVFVFETSDGFLNVKIPELILRKQGYEQEMFSASWVFPENLKKRLSRWKTAPVDRTYSKTVIFQNPTRASAQTSVTIDCATGPTKIYALDAAGGPGRLVGTTPYACTIGYSPLRDTSGTIQDWKCWSAKDSEN